MEEAWNGLSANVPNEIGDIPSNDVSAEKIEIPNQEDDFQMANELEGDERLGKGECHRRCLMLKY
jgi:hypothetical protein